MFLLPFSVFISPINASTEWLRGARVTPEYEHSWHPRLIRSNGAQFPDLRTIPANVATAAALENEREALYAVPQPFLVSRSGAPYASQAPSPLRRQQVAIMNVPNYGGSRGNLVGEEYSGAASSMGNSRPTIQFHSNSNSIPTGQLFPSNYNPREYSPMNLRRESTQFENNNSFGYQQLNGSPGPVYGGNVDFMNNNYANFNGVLYGAQQQPAGMSPVMIPFPQPQPSPQQQQQPMMAPQQQQQPMMNNSFGYQQLNGPGPVYTGNVVYPSSNDFMNNNYMNFNGVLYGAQQQPMMGSSAGMTPVMNPLSPPQPQQPQPMMNPQQPQPMLAPQPQQPMMAPQQPQPMTVPQPQQPMMAPQQQQSMMAPQQQQPMMAPQPQQPMMAPQQQQPMMAPQQQQPMVAPQQQQQPMQVSTQVDHSIEVRVSGMPLAQGMPQQQPQQTQYLEPTYVPIQQPVPPLSNPQPGQQGMQAVPQGQGVPPQPQPPYEPPQPQPPYEPPQAQPPYVPPQPQYVPPQQPPYVPRQPVRPIPQQQAAPLPQPVARTPTQPVRPTRQPKGPIEESEEPAQTEPVEEPQTEPVEEPPQTKPVEEPARPRRQIDTKIDDDNMSEPRGSMSREEQKLPSPGPPAQATETVPKSGSKPETNDVTTKTDSFMRRMLYSMAPRSFFDSPATNAAAESDPDSFARHQQHPPSRVEVETTTLTHKRYRPPLSSLTQNEQQQQEEKRTIIYPKRNDSPYEDGPSAHAGLGHSVRMPRDERGGGGSRMNGRFAQGYPLEHRQRGGGENTSFMRFGQQPIDIKYGQ